MRSQAITVSVRVPWRSGSALKVGRSMIVSFGTKLVERLARRADQQVADEQRMPGEFGDDAGRQGVARASAPPIRSWTKRSLPAAWASMSCVQRVEMRRRHRLVVVPPDRGRRCCASRTTNLSFGERPVCWPVRATQRAVRRQLTASPRRSASSIKLWLRKIVTDRVPVSWQSRSLRSAIRVATARVLSWLSIPSRLGGSDCPTRKLTLSSSQMTRRTESEKTQ